MTYLARNVPFFIDYLKESDHTPHDDLPDEHAYELGGADYLDSVLLEANEQFKQPGNFLSTPSVANHTAILCSYSYI